MSPNRILTREEEILKVLRRTLETERRRQTNAKTTQEATFAAVRQAMLVKILDLVEAPFAVHEWREAKHDLLHIAHLQPDRVYK